MQPASLHFSEELLAEVRQELEPLLQESWKAVADSYPTSRLKPDFELYLRLEEQGAMRVFTSRADGVLIGYAIVLVTTHPHRTEDIVATIDTVFVLPEFREGGTAAKLFQCVEENLRVDHVHSLSVIARDPVFERWLRMAHYGQVETVWERIL